MVLVQIFQRTLKEMGLDARVFASDMDPMMAPACHVADQCFLVPPCPAEGFVDELIGICREHQVGVVVPTIDSELELLAANRERLEAVGTLLAEPDKEFVRICRDKRLTASFFQKLGIEVPKMLDRHHPAFREYKEFTVDMYYGLDGRVKGIVPRERIEVRSGEINKGVARKNYLVDFLKRGMNMVKGVRGCICIQLFYRESDHDIKGIEINPRFGGGFPLSFYAGANFAEYIIKEYLLGEKIDYSETWLDNTKLLRYDDNVIIYNADR